MYEAVTLFTSGYMLVYWYAAGDNPADTEEQRAVRVTTRYMGFGLMAFGVYRAVRR